MKKVLFCFLIIIGCSKEKQTIYDEMKSDELLSGYFSNSELKDLTKIVDFFESEMCKDERKELSILDCYNAFLKKDSIFLTKGDVQEFIDYKEQEKLYKRIDSNFFNNLFSFGEVTMFYGDDSPLYVDCYHLKIFDSKYYKFLKEFSKKDKYVKEYLETCEVVNEFSSTGSKFSLSYHYKRYDVNDIKIRLLYAFYFLDINSYHIYPDNKFFEKRNKK